MRVVTPQITWHNKDPVLCVDFDPSSYPNNDPGTNEGCFYRLASGGSDSHVLIWHLRKPSSVKVEFVCVADLSRHTKAVNALRFSPCGKFLASADDDAYVYIWRNDTDKMKPEEELWMVEKALRKHIDDVSDMSWSKDSTRLVTTSVDNSAIIWDVKKGVPLHIWSEHGGFVQGVSVDPAGDFVATISTDRLLRIFNSHSGKLVTKALKYPSKWVPKVEKALVVKNDISSPEGKHDNQLKKSTPVSCNRLFHDDTLKSFCRRLNYSPNGEFLIIPGGILPPKREDADKTMSDGITVLTPNSKKLSNSGKDKAPSDRNAVILFCRNSFTNPCCVIPTGVSYSIAARFCPLYFQRNRDVIPYDKELTNPTKKSERLVTCVGKLKGKSNGKKSLLNMPYRLVFAIATNDSLIICDTDSTTPLATIRNIHLTRMSDLSWSSDGRVLIVSSTDGYCSVISFEENELGVRFEGDLAPVLPLSFPVPPLHVNEAKKKSKDSSQKDEEKNSPSTPMSSKSKKRKEPIRKIPAPAPVKVIPRFFKGNFKHKMKIDMKQENDVISSPDISGVKLIQMEYEHKSENKTLEIAGFEPITSGGGVIEEQKKEQTEVAKDKISLTPKRNTFLERWLKKTPGSKDTHVLPASIEAGNCESDATTVPLVKTIEAVVNCSGSNFSPPLDMNPKVVLRPLISPQQIHQLKNSPIIVDLEADNAAAAASVILSSSDVSVVSGGKFGATARDLPPTPTGNGVALPSPVTPQLKQAFTLTPNASIREKRPATSPLTSQQKPKQPRRVEFITLPRSPRKES